MEGRADVLAEGGAEMWEQSAGVLCTAGTSASMASARQRLPVENEHAGQGDDGQRRGTGEIVIGTYLGRRRDLERVHAMPVRRFFHLFIF